MKRLLLLLSLAAALGAQAQVKWPKAVLHLKNDREFDAEVLIRDDKDWVRVRKADSPGEIRLPVADITGIEFDLRLREIGADAPYYDGKFAESAQRLSPIVEPVVRFMDIRNNAYDDVLHLVQSWYWSGNYSQTVTTCENILRRTDAQPFAREVMIFRILAALNLGDFYRVEKLSAELPMPGVHDEWGAPYWAIKSMLLSRDKKWHELLEASARLIAFHSRQPEWMPVGLALSARAHLMEGRPEIARQILRETRVAYPETRWQSLADEVDAEVKKAEELAKKTAAAAAAAAPAAPPAVPAAPETPAEPGTP